MRFIRRHRIGLWCVVLIPAGAVLLAIGLLVRRAEASVREGLNGMGASLLSVFDAPGSRGLTRRLRINGETVDFDTGTTAMEPDEILSAFQKSHAGHGGGLARMPRMVLGGGDRGCAIAVDLGDEDLDPKQLQALLRTAAEAKLPGDVDYLYAERSAGGTRFFSLHAAKGADLAKLLADDDGACTVMGLSRPEGTRCLFSACEDAAGFCLAVYGLGDDTDEKACAGRAESWVRKEGWIPRPVAGGLFAVQEQGYLFASCSGSGKAPVLTVVGKTAP